MTNHLIQGKNVAEERLRGGNQTNTGNKIGWVNNTNNVGRAHHAEGDSVGEDRQEHGFGGDVWNGIKSAGKFLGNTAVDVGTKVLPQLAMQAATKYGPMALGLLAEGGQPQKQARRGGGDIAWHHAEGQQPGPIGQTYGQNQVSQSSPNTSTIEQQNAMRCGGSAKKRGR